MLTYYLNCSLNRLSWTNIHDATFMWEESQQDRLKGVGTRAALMQCRLRQGFDESAEGYYKQRIEKHYSSKAINLKAVLSGLTFGVVPHVLSWNLPGLRDGHRKLDSALFGQVSPKPVSGLDPGIAEAVLRGMEDMAWYEGVLERGESLTRGDDVLMVLDRKGKLPIFQYRVEE